MGVHECLKDHIETLSDACKEEEFSQEAIAETSIDFKPVLMSACGPDLAKYCGGISRHDGAALECLENQKDNQDLSRQCRKKLLKSLILKMKNIDFWPDLKKCKKEMKELCPDWKKDRDQWKKFSRENRNNPQHDHIAGKMSFFARAIDCVVEQRQKFKKPFCRDTGNRIAKLRATDARLMPALHEKCQADVEKFCKDVQPGEGRTHRCLRDHLAELSTECAQLEFKVQKDKMNDITLRPVLRKHCTDAVALFCKDVPHGDPRLLGAWRRIETPTACPENANRRS